MHTTIRAHTYIHDSALPSSPTWHIQSSLRRLLTGPAFLHIPNSGSVRSPCPGQLAVLTTPPDAPRPTPKHPHKPRAGARPAYDPESHLERLLGRTPSRPTAFDTAPRSALPATTITLTLLDSTTAAPVPAHTGRPAFSPVAAIPITTAALKHASQQSGVADSLAAAPSEQPEVALALVSLPYSGRERSALRGSAPEAHAILAASSYGRILIWDTGVTEVLHR